ncbi:uncharacterized protein LOC120291608 [Eucalyptus grandis]|uniref:uncharacterized protein LOC120291608 n=1 Tax=Eucalyptus grandis TaxID=71139 RepID=UPI00192EE4D7|nr:uncharacterized protein LOC120291608 [Eucalyptus grandis]
MVTLFHDMMHEEIEVYVDDMIAKTRPRKSHVETLKKLFDRLREFKLRLNPTKCVFEAASGKLLGFMVSSKGIEIDPSKAKAICELQPPSIVKEVRSLLGRLNYIARFISQLSETAKPFFKLLRKNVQVEWNEECREAFDKLKQYLMNPPVLVPPISGHPLILYLTIHSESLGAMLAQKSPVDQKERAIYYLSKKFTVLELKYFDAEKTCAALVWVLHRLRQYTLHYQTFLMTENDPIKYLFHQPALVGKLAKWQVLISEFDVQFMPQKSVKGRVIADILAENPRILNDDDCPLDDRILAINEDAWSMFFDGAAAIETGVAKLKVYGDSALIILQTVGEWKTRDAKLLPYHKYLEELVKEFDEISFDYLARSHNQFADALATLSSMLQVTNGLEVEPLKIEVLAKPSYCMAVNKELDEKPWYCDIMSYIQKQEFPEGITPADKKYIMKMASKFFVSAVEPPFVSERATVSARHRCFCKQHFRSREHQQFTHHRDLQPNPVAFRGSAPCVCSIVQQSDPCCATLVTPVRTPPRLRLCSTTLPPATQRSEPTPTLPGAEDQQPDAATQAAPPSRRPAARAYAALRSNTSSTVPNTCTRNRASARLRPSHDAAPVVPHPVRL